MSKNHLAVALRRYVIVLCDGTTEGVKEDLEKRRDLLESNGLKVSG